MNEEENHMRADLSNSHSKYALEMYRCGIIFTSCIRPINDRITMNIISLAPNAVKVKMRQTSMVICRQLEILARLDG